MRLIIFGATGETGRRLTREALDEGHEVAVFVRKPSKLEEAGINRSHGRLRVIKSNIHYAQCVDAAIKGQDAVLSALGQTKNSSGDVATVAATNMVPAMKRYGVNRLVSLVCAGVADAEDPSSLRHKMMRALMKVTTRRIHNDAELHAEIVRKSGLDWTLVRPPRLTNEPKKGNYRTGYMNLGPRDTISRADLADFMLTLATEGGYEQEAPMISY